jgi:hypothetical protein
LNYASFIEWLNPKFHQWLWLSTILELIILLLLY